MNTLGIQVDSYDLEQVTVSVDVDSRLHQPTGVVHGGVYVLLAETAASIAANLRLDLTTHAAFGMEINANHLRPVSSGRIRAIATCLHEGKTTQVYSIDVLDEKDRRVCVSRCTMAVRAHRTS